MRDEYGNKRTRSGRLFGTLALLAMAMLLPGSAAQAGGNACKQTARKMYSSCQAEVKEEYEATRANCLNFATEDERDDCQDEARDTRKEDRSGCGDQKEARVDACELLDEDRYDTEALLDEDGSRMFVDLDSIGAGTPVNPFFSLEPGDTRVLRAGEDFEELVVVHVTDESREVLGQPCRIVVDAVLLVEEEEPSVGVAEVEYEAVEITDDLYAQAMNGDVYYCGEVSRNFEDGVLRDLEGSFEAGFPPDDYNAAKSGILIKANPDVGDAHRQEFLLGDAEDLITYVGDAEDVPVEEGGDNPLFPCDAQCLKTEEFIPPEPESGEFKYYRAGTGFVLGVALEDGEPTGERDELVCMGDSLAILSHPSCGIADPEGLLEILCRLSPDAFCADGEEE